VIFVVKEGGRCKTVLGWYHAGAGVVIRALIPLLHKNQVTKLCLDGIVCLCAQRITENDY